MCILFDNKYSWISFSLGTSFRFQLPHDSVLQPVTSITPPCETLPPPCTATTAIGGQTKESLDKVHATNISPSAVSGDFFTRSVTPSLSLQQDGATAAQCANSAGQLSNITNNKEQDNCGQVLSSRACDALRGEESPPVVPGSTSSRTFNLRSLRERMTLTNKNPKPCFQLGTSEHEESYSDVDYSSPPLLPLIDMPSDSQFDISEDLESYFKVQKPSLNCSVASNAADGDDKDTEAACKSLFSEVVATKRQKVAPLSGDMASIEKHLNSEQQGAADMPVVMEVVHNMESTPSSDQMEIELAEEPEEAASTTKLRSDELPVSKEKAPISVVTESETSQAPASLPNISLTSTASSKGGSSPIPSLRLTQSTANRLSPGRPLGAVHSPVNTRLQALSVPIPNSYLAPAEFVSPSKKISSERFMELKRNIDEQVGKEVDRYELRHVRTVRTVIEERFISSELVDSGTAVAGTERFWPVRKGWVGMSLCYMELHDKVVFVLCGMQV